MKRTKDEKIMILKQKLKQLIDEIDTALRKAKE